VGYVKHSAIIVTGKDLAIVGRARSVASVLQLVVTDVVADSVNGYHSFLVAPDGSKEGWIDSDLGDQRRDQFVEWIRVLPDTEGHLDWIDVEYGGDHGREIGAAIVRHGDADPREDPT
jgi:hypothetical protein